MTPPPLIKNRWLRWLLLAAFWTAIGLSFAAQVYLSNSRLGRPLSWSYVLNHALFDWYVFAVLAPVVVWLSHQFPIDRTNWRVHLPLHLVASGAFALVYIVLRAWVSQVQGWFTNQPTGFADAFQPLLLKTFHFDLLIYWVILTVGHALNYYRKAQERELHASELQRHLVQARLQALQMQLNPHFLFNTLHAISALMHKDVEAADSMIARLSELLRYALESTSAQEVPLRQELDFLERYIEIEQTRFGDRLLVQKSIDPAALEVRVPNLILQPLVENAIRHGIEPHVRRGEITLWARRQDGALHLEVRDNGAGLVNGNGSPEEGVGLSNTRARLAELYGDQYQFEFRNGEHGGLIVHLSIPCRIDASGPPGHLRPPPQSKPNS
jgi:two-component sensor histidine kinase